MKQDTIQLENVDKAAELQIVQETKQKVKVQHGFDLNKTFYYEDGGEIHPGDGVVQEMKEEKKVQHEFDLNEKRFYYPDGVLHPDKGIQKVKTDMLKIYMPDHF